MTDFLEITDVTLRDGLQMESRVLSVDEKLQLFHLLVPCGYSRIEFTSFAHPKWMPQFADSEILSPKLTSLPAPGIELMAFVPNEKGCERLLKFPIPWATAFVAVSETFNQKNVNTPIAQTLVELRQMTQRIKGAGRRIRIYISTAFGCPYEGNMPLEKTMALLEKIVALGPDEIAVSDTIGVGTPTQTKAILKRLAPLFPVKQTAVHFHNTYGLAMGNCEAAWEMGVRKMDSSTGGVGGCPYAKGATGNLASEDLLFGFHQALRVKEFKRTELSAALTYLSDVAKVNVQSRLNEIQRKGGKWYGIGESIGTP